MPDVYNPNCTDCALHQNANFVCMPGRGSWGAPGLVVGEAPGRKEDVEGRPFVGDAGEYLRVALRGAGLVPDEDVFLTNAAKCRPTTPEGKFNLKPGPAQIEACRQYLIKEVELLQPRAMLLLGGPALEAFIPRPHTPTVTRARGTLLPSPRISPHTKVTATWHPSYVLRKGGAGYPTGEQFDQDIALFADLLKSSLWVDSAG